MPGALQSITQSNNAQNGGQGKSSYKTESNSQQSIVSQWKWHRKM